jgi:hypothetical protein
MVLTRRRSLRLAGAGGVALIAGCTGLESRLSGRDEGRREYLLDLVPIRSSLVEFALYEPDSDPIFGAPAREALDAILPEGRYTTYGYEPLPENEYVERDGRYFETGVVTTGAKRIERSVVRLDPRDEDREVPESAVPVESLSRADARVVKILHGHAVTDGRGGASSLLDDGGYVLRRPAETDGRLATDLDGAVVTLGDAWTYRVDVSTRSRLEPAYTAVATPIAEDRAAFRQIALATRVDARLRPSSLPESAREKLQRAIRGEDYGEETPLSESYRTLLDALDLGTEAENGLVLLYDGDLYHYGLYVNDAG